MISISRVCLSLIRGTPCNNGAAVALPGLGQPLDPAFPGQKTREHSSQQFLSGSMVSLWLSSNTSPSILVELDELAHHCLQPLHALGPVVFKCTWQIPEDIEIRQEAVIHVQRSAS